MKKIFYFVLLMIVAVSCTSKNDWKAEHVFLVGFDGWGSFSMETVKMPNTRALMEEGCYTLDKRTVNPSVSAPNWASMFAGAPVSFHGWADNGSGPCIKPIYVNENGVFPTIFSLLREQTPDAEIGCVYEWGGIRPLVDEKAHNYCVQEDPKKLTATSVEYIKSKKPNLFAVIYDDPDHVGHGVGYKSAAYDQKMEELDAALGEIIAATKEAGIYENSVFIVTSDHGGIGQGHGGYDHMEVDTPFIIAGKGIKKGGKFSEAMMMYDTAHTIAEIFGIEVPQIWNGQSMSQVFEK